MKKSLLFFRGFVLAAALVSVSFAFGMQKKGGDGDDKEKSASCWTCCIGCLRSSAPVAHAAVAGLPVVLNLAGVNGSAVTVATTVANTLLGILNAAIQEDPKSVGELVAKAASPAIANLTADAVTFLQTRGLANKDGSISDVTAAVVRSAVVPTRAGGLHVLSIEELASTGGIVQNI